ncbi:hypothetical protein ACIA59_16825 [Micromonospora haikouensis]|uniref:hypothetical protein n=1 Tax=Micromonospora haikouensis TaxID=686309 RepID=UPI0037B869CA
MLHVLDFHEPRDDVLDPLEGPASPSRELHHVDVDDVRPKRTLPCSVTGGGIAQALSIWVQVMQGTENVAVSRPQRHPEVRSEPPHVAGQFPEAMAASGARSASTSQTGSGSAGSSSNLQLSAIRRMAVFNMSSKACR